MQTRGPQAKSQEPIESEKDGGRVTAASSEPAAHRNPFLDLDVEGRLTPRPPEQFEGGSHRQVAFVEGNQRVSTRDRHTGRTRTKRDRVRQGHRLKHRPQLVIAVLPDSEDL